MSDTFGAHGATGVGGVQADTPERAEVPANAVTGTANAPVTAATTTMGHGRILMIFIESPCW